MKKEIKEIKSKPTMCLKCHQLQEMVLTLKENGDKDYWTCRSCNHVYDCLNWRIRRK